MGGGREDGFVACPSVLPPTTNGACLLNDLELASAESELAVGTVAPDEEVALVVGAGSVR